MIESQMGKRDKLTLEKKAIDENLKWTENRACKI